jgi:hypothetical protein
MTDSAPALTVHQPWAELILRSRKQIELRSWSTSHRGLLWLHAGARVDEDAAARFAIGPQFTGGYVGAVEIAAIVYLDEKRWETWKDTHLSGHFTPGIYGWLLARPIRFSTPIPGPGRQKLFTPDTALQEQLRDAYEAVCPP